MLITARRQKNKYRNVKVFGGRGLWDSIKSVARRIFGSDSGKKLLQKGVDAIAKFAPALISKGVDAATNLIPDHPLFNPGGRTVAGLREKAKPFLEGLVSKGALAGRDKLLAFGADKSGFAGAVPKDQGVAAQMSQTFAAAAKKPTAPRIRGKKGRRAAAAEPSPSDLPDLAGAGLVRATGKSKTILHQLLGKR